MYSKIQSYPSWESYSSLPLLLGSVVFLSTCCLLWHCTTGAEESKHSYHSRPRACTTASIMDPLFSKQNCIIWSHILHTLILTGKHRLCTVGYSNPVQRSYLSLIPGKLSPPLERNLDNQDRSKTYLLLNSWAKYCDYSNACQLPQIGINV